MKKIFAVLICICTVLMVTACSTSNAESDKQTKSLTYHNNDDNEKYTTNVIETEEGVTILCSSKYVMGPESGGGFVFMLADWSEECLEDDYDWRVTFVSNGRICKTEFYDHEGNIITTEECNGVVTVDNRWNDVYVDKVVLYIEYEDETYSAEMIRSGM